MRSRRARGRLSRRLGRGVRRVVGRAREPRAATPDVAAAARAEDSGAQERLFESFIEGPGNALALEAARLIARGQAGRCSPLFLYANTGMGKTHLCRAIQSQLGNMALYRSSEEFTTEVTEALRAGQMPRIRQRYRRSTNVLILEDVQFLAGKRATQVELFHTLDHLMSHGNARWCCPRIARRRSSTSSTRSSRRAWRRGWSRASLRPSTRRGSRSCASAPRAGACACPTRAWSCSPRATLSSVRDLVGGLNQVVARASLLKAAITPELVAQALAAVELPGRARSLEEIMAETARAYGVARDDLRARSRKQSLVRPRQIAMYLARRYTDASLAEIGRAFSRDHTSVMYAIDVVERRIVEKPQLRYELEALAQRVSGGPPRRSASGSTRGTPPI